MAIVIVESPFSEEIIELSGASAQEVEIAKHFWQTAYLLPQGESSLVCIRQEVLQRLPSKAPGETFVRGNSRDIIYKDNGTRGSIKFRRTQDRFSLPPRRIPTFYELIRLKRLAKARLEIRALYEKLRNRRLWLEEPRNRMYREKDEKLRARLEQLLSMPTPEQVAEAQRTRFELVDFEVDHMPAEAPEAVPGSPKMTDRVESSSDVEPDPELEVELAREWAQRASQLVNAGRWAMKEEEREQLIRLVATIDNISLADSSQTQAQPLDAQSSLADTGSGPCDETSAHGANQQQQPSMSPLEEPTVVASERAD